MLPTRPSRANPLKSTVLLAVLLGAATLSAVPAAADWLMTTHGTAIETDGPWKVKGRLVIFTDARGTLSLLRLDAVDLEASKAVTAKGGPAAGDPPQSAEPEDSARPPVLELTNADIGRAEHNRPAAELTLAPKVIMYSTSWCGYCRKARKLLKELGVEFVEKDIEKSSQARREHAAKGGRGVPVFDFDGTIVRGYRADVIRRQAARFQTAGQTADSGEREDG